jgi:electron transport complex protein RnfA
MDRRGSEFFGQVARDLVVVGIAIVVAALLAMLSGYLNRAHGAEPPAGAGAVASPGARIVSARVVTPDRLEVRLSSPIERTDPANFRVSDVRAPDIALPVREVRVGSDGRLSLVVAHKLRPSEAYRLEIAEPPLTRSVRPSPWALFFTVILSSALINNFVFTRYLGLCIFFGITRKRDAAVGMGATFTLVMVTTGMLSWLLFAFVLKPLQLTFLQILVFIGVVAFLVQMLDTVLKKTHGGLHKKFGIYLMLITTNCIILAVPLLNAAADSGPIESFALAMGSGLGFALALFLMSCARERMELARVPASFEGLPIAFALAGLFALAFMGFSGLDFYR